MLVSGMSGVSVSRWERPLSVVPVGMSVVSVGMSLSSLQCRPSGISSGMSSTRNIVPVRIVVPMAFVPLQLSHETELTRRRALVRNQLTPLLVQSFQFLRPQSVIWNYRNSCVSLSSLPSLHPDSLNWITRFTKLQQLTEQTRRDWTEIQSLVEHRAECY